MANLNGIELKRARIAGPHGGALIEDFQNVINVPAGEFNILIESARNEGMQVSGVYERRVDTTGAVQGRLMAFLGRKYGLTLADVIVAGENLKDFRAEVAAAFAAFEIANPKPLGKIVYLDGAAMVEAARAPQTDENEFVVASFADVPDVDESDGEPEGATSGARIRNAKKAREEKLGPAPWSKKADAGETINLRETGKRLVTDPETGATFEATDYAVVEDESEIVEITRVESPKDRKNRLRRESWAKKKAAK